MNYDQASINKGTLEPDFGKFEVKGGDGSEPSAGSEPAKGGGRPLTD